MNQIATVARASCGFDDAGTADLERLWSRDEIARPVHREWQRDQSNVRCKSLETQSLCFLYLFISYGLEATALVRQKARLWYQAKLCPQEWSVYTGLVSFSFLLRAPQIPSTKNVLLARHEIERELRVKVPSLSDAWQQWGENNRTSNSTAMFLVAVQFLHFPSLADSVPRYCMSRYVHFSTWVRHV